MSCKGGGSGGVQGPGWRVSEDINENVNECIVLMYKGGGSEGVQGPGWRYLKYKWKWKFEMEIEINQGTEVTGAALVVMTMTKAATLIFHVFLKSDFTDLYPSFGGTFGKSHRN